MGRVPTLAPLADVAQALELSSELSFLRVGPVPSTGDRFEAVLPVGRLDLPVTEVEDHAIAEMGMTVESDVEATPLSTSRSKVGSRPCSPSFSTGVGSSPSNPRTTTFMPDLPAVVRMTSLSRGDLERRAFRDEWPTLSIPL